MFVLARNGLCIPLNISIYTHHLLIIQFEPVKALFDFYDIVDQYEGFFQLVDKG